jgi:hypothetical protein
VWLERGLKVGDSWKLNSKGLNTILDSARFVIKTLTIPNEYMNITFIILIVIFVIVGWNSRPPTWPTDGEIS